MKKISILLFGALLIAASGCRDKKVEAQAQIAKLQAQQDSIRRADEQRILGLQMRAREDSLAMASIMNDLTSERFQQRSLTYYIVTGSFKERGNANAYLKDMKNIFGQAQIIRKGTWNYVCVNGSFSSRSSARAVLDDVIAQLVGGGSGGSGGSDEEEEDVDGEEMLDEEDVDVGAEDELGEEDEETDESSFGSEGGGEAWVLDI
jgi:hypothetical protein